MSAATQPRICIIGAGPSGLAAAKNCLQAGLRHVVVYERQHEVGGNWLFSPGLAHSSVYETTHIISSKTLSQFDDFPMPDDYPDYPSHRQVLAYFQAYARHFGLYEVIRFNTEVTRAEKLPDERWRITLGDGAAEVFDYLLVASGHHWDPRWPSFPGQETFTGQLLHSHQFKSAAPYKDQRVLVIGAGNSAADIAVETGRVSAFTAMSLRRGQYFVPKFAFGYPSDVLNARLTWLPRPLFRLAQQLVLYMQVGDYRQYGLPRPQHGLLQAHITLNNELLYYIRHGRIHPRPNIERIAGDTVHFVDGRTEPYDVIIAATGFHISFPFFDRAFIDYDDGRPVGLYLLTFHPQHRTLFFIGLVQPLGAIWPLADAQSQLAVQAMLGCYTPPADMQRRIERDLAQRARRYVRSARHTVEVEFQPYLAALRRELRHAVRSG